MDDGYLGEIRAFAGNFPPRNWAFCDGQLLAISQYNALFSILGTRFGGDGRTTFGLPELRGRTIISPGTGPGLPTYQEGAKGGNYETTFSVSNLPAHNHIVDPGYADTPDNNDPNGRYPANVGQPVYGSAKSGNMGDAAVSNTGGNVPFSNMMPYQSIYYIICISGLFPSRS